MTQALNIAASSLDAATIAMDTVAENVANAETPGYVAESADMEALPAGTNGIGSGVETSVSQNVDTMLETSSWQAQGQLSSLAALQQVLSSVVGLFPLGSAGTSSSTTTSETGIAGELATFWNSWDMIAQDPSSSAARVQTVDDAQAIAVSLNQAATQLAQFGVNTNDELSNQLSEVNSLLQQVAELNGSITQTANPQSANQLEDQLRQVLGTLAQLAGAQVRMQEDGTATVILGGVTVVQATTANTLELESSGTPPQTGIVLATAPGVDVPLAGGSVSGLLSALNVYLPQYQSELDELATSIETAVDSQLAEGYTATGASGATHPLFTGSGAAGISVSETLVAHPTLLAASTTSTPAAAKNNGANAQAMAELATLATGPDSLYRTLVQNIGTDTQSTDSQLSAATAVATQSQAALQSVTGVDVTTELTKLLSYEQMYQASAKLLAIADTAISSLLEAVS